MCLSSNDAAVWYLEHVLPNKPVFLRVAMRVLGDADEAENIVQDVLTEMLRDERWRVVPRAKMYIIKAIYSRCIDYLRRLKVVPMRQFLDAEEGMFADDTPDAHQVLEGRDTMARVMEALDTLPEKIKLVFTLSTIGNLSVQDIAKRLGTNETLVRRQIKRGRYLLTKALIQEGVPIEDRGGAAKPTEADNA